MEFLRRFKAQDSEAHICNTASENSIGWPMPFMSGYNASKAAVLGYTGMLRMELPDHITISLLCPGWTRTDIGNSGTKRQDRFGGPKPARPHYPQEGDHMPYEVDTVGAHSLAEIKNGSFYIFPIMHRAIWPKSAMMKSSPLLMPKPARQRIGKKTIRAVFMRRCKRARATEIRALAYESITGQ